MPASSWEPMYPVTGKAEAKAQAKGLAGPWPSTFYDEDSQPTMKSGAPQPAKSTAILQPAHAFLSGNLPNFLVKNAPPPAPPPLPPGNTAMPYLGPAKPPPPLPRSNVKSPPNCGASQPAKSASGSQPSTMQVTNIRPPPGLGPPLLPPPGLAPPAGFKSTAKAVLQSVPKEPRPHNSSYYLPKGVPKWRG